MKYSLFFIAAALLMLGACSKKETTPLSPTNLQIQLQHTVGGQPLLFDSMAYHNGAGEIYSISKLQYFISEISFYHSGELVYNIDTIAYIDAQRDEYVFERMNVSPFIYDSVSYSIGVPTSYNEHGKLAATYENIAMEWPEVMGGGYHFIKLEGHWKDNGAITGYTVHLGTNPYLVKGGYKYEGSITAGTQNNIAFKMDINEWFEHPNTYSFKSDGVYTMGDAVLMQKISENGRDVIKVSQ